MALQLLGTVADDSLNCLPAWSAVLSQADVAAISQSIIDDSMVASILAGWGPGASAVLATGATNSNTTLDTLVATGGGPLATIRVGDLVLRADVPPGTFVVDKPTGTSVTLSQAATGSNSLDTIFARPAQTNGVTLDGATLLVPKRGILKILPGDVVAVDNTGWPILVSAASIGYAGSLWTVT